MKCRILWWQVTGDASRGNRIAFENIGVKTELINRNIIPQAHLQFGADFIFTGMIYEMINWAGMGFIGLPSIIQGGGYGPNFMPDGKIDRLFEKVTEIPKSVITILDSNYYFNMLESDLPFDYNRIYLVPNGLSRALVQFPIFPQKKDPNEFLVFNPSGNFWIKQPDKFIEATKLVAEQDVPIKFIFPIKTMGAYSAPIQWLDYTNLQLMPIQSFPQMMMLYQKADLVATYSEAEILPTTFFESLWFKKPTVHSCPGMLQSISKSYLKELKRDFGEPIDEFHRKWKSRYLKGQHFKYVRNPEEFAKAIIELYDHPQKRERLAKRGNEWIQKWWNAEDKCQLLVDMLVERNLIGND